MKSSTLNTRITETLIEDVEIFESKKKPRVGSREGMTDLARSGTWMEQHHLDAASRKGDKFIQDTYDRAARISDPMEQEAVINQVFNNKSVARNYAIKAHAKEIRSGTTSISPDQLDTLRQNIYGDNNASMTIRINDNMRNPEEITGSNEVVDLLYASLDAKWPGRPQNKMILTYLLMVYNIAHLVKTSKAKELPYFNRVMVIVNQMEKDKKDWKFYTNFIKEAGISRKMYETVRDHMVKYIEKIT